MVNSSLEACYRCLEQGAPPCSDELAFSLRFYWGNSGTPVCEPLYSNHDDRVGTTRIRFPEYQMSTNSTRIMAAVSDHWLLGSLPLQDSRIQEQLNDSSTDFVKLRDVEIHAHAKRKCVAKFQTMVVPKCKLEFIIAPSGTHEAPEKSWNNRVAKAAFSTFAIVCKYRIQGTLYLPPTAFDTQRALMHQGGRFFPLTQVSLGYGGQGVQEISVPLLLVNKDFVSCFEIDDHVNLKCPGVQQHTTPETKVGDLEENSLAVLLKNVDGLLAEPNDQAESQVNSPVG